MILPPERHIRGDLTHLPSEARQHHQNQNCRCIRESPVRAGRGSSKDRFCLHGHSGHKGRPCAPRLSSGHSVARRGLKAKERGGQ